MMASMLRASLVILGVGLATFASAGARVEIEDGRIGAVLEDAAVPEVLDAIRRASGLEIVLPASALSKRLTLTIERLPPEQFLRRLLHALDLGGFALVFEGDGSARRVIVVERSSAPPTPEVPASPTQPAEAPAAAETGPVYVPPREPPVYIPPRQPPVYIPPRQPPVYIPPASPPVYVPPATESEPTPPTR